MEKIYTDGACSGNPGKGGFSAVRLKGTEVVEVIHDREAQTTNNRMELRGFIAGLEMAEATCNKCEIHVDSEYVLKGITTWVKSWRKNGWKTSTGDDVKNRDLWEKADALYRENKNNLRVVKVKGHSGDVGNDLADKYAVQAMN